MHVRINFHLCETQRRKTRNETAAVIYLATNHGFIMLMSTSMDPNNASEILPSILCVPINRTIQQNNRILQDDETHFNSKLFLV